MPTVHGIEPDNIAISDGRSIRRRRCAPGFRGPSATRVTNSSDHVRYAPRPTVTRLAASQTIRSGRGGRREGDTGGAGIPLAARSGMWCHQELRIFRTDPWTPHRTPPAGVAPVAVRSRPHACRLEHLGGFFQVSPCASCRRPRCATSRGLTAGSACAAPCR